MKRTSTSDDSVFQMFSRAADYLVDAPDSETSAEREIWLTVTAALARGLWGPKTDCSPLEDWFGIALPVSEDVLNAVSEGIHLDFFTLREIGKFYEARMASTDGALRKDKGAYFTPIEIAQELIAETLEPLLAGSTVSEILALAICDPAAGAGGFALPLVDFLAEHLQGKIPQMNLLEAKELVLNHCVYFVDVDPMTVALLRSLLWISAGSSMLLPQKLEQRVVVGDALLYEHSFVPPASSVNWTSVFPEVFSNGGFTAIVGNPPWGGLRPMISRWHTGDGGTWADYSVSRREYASYLKSNSSYSLQGKGDADLYRYFLERSLQLLNARGRLGMVVPSAFLRAEGAVPLRRHMFQNGTFDSIVEYWNTKRVFDIHSMFRFVTMVWGRGSHGGVASLSLGNTAVPESHLDSIHLSAEYISRVSGSRMSIPDVRSSQEVALLDSLVRCHPMLGERLEGSWNIGFVRELDMTNASERFVRVQAAAEQGAVMRPDGTWAHPSLGTLLPVYEGRMVNQHDSLAKAYVSGTGRSAVWTSLLPENKVCYPQYLVRESERHPTETVDGFRAGFCDVTGHANERTVLAAVLGPNCVAGNKVPTVRFDNPNTDLHFLWVAIANSFVIDWIARRRVSTSLNYFQWMQIPFPRLDPDSVVGSRLVHLCKMLVDWSPGIDSRSQLEDRALIRSEIDALVAIEFDLDLRTMVRIFSDFPLLDRDPKGKRGTQTRDLVVWKMAQLRGIRDVSMSDLDLLPDGGASSIAERVDAARRLGKLAYVPGELNKLLTAPTAGMSALKFTG